MRRISPPDLPALLLYGLLGLLWTAAVAAPLIVGLTRMGLAWSDALNTLEQSGAWSWDAARRALLATFAWSVAVAAGALLLAWLPARALARAGTGSRPPRRGAEAQRLRHAFRVIARILPPPPTAWLAACLAIPSYLIYWIWGLGRVRIDGLGPWIAAGDRWRGVLIDHLQLGLGLILWSWPLAAIVLAADFRRTPRELPDLLALDGPGVCRRLAVHVAAARAGIVAAGTAVFLTTMVNTAAFDLASINTYANMLRRLWADTAALEAGLIAALPMLVLGLSATIPAVVLWERTIAPAFTRSDSGLTVGDAPPRLHSWGGRVRRSGGLLAAVFPPVLLAVTLGGPVVLLLGELGGLSEVRGFLEIESAVLLQGLGVAAVSGTALAGIALGLAAAWSSHRRTLRMVATGLAVTWVWIGLIPPPTIGSLLILVWNQPRLGVLHEVVYQGPAMLVFAHLARFGVVAVIFARWLALSEPPMLRDLRMLDRATSITGWMRARGPGALIGVMMAVLSFGIALGLSEVATTMVVTPAGWQSPAERLLNRMHYARESAVAVSSLLLIGFVFILACVAVAALRLAARQSDVGDQREPGGRPFG